MKRIVGLLLLLTVDLVSAMENDVLPLNQVPSLQQLAFQVAFYKKFDDITLTTKNSGGRELIENAMRNVFEHIPKKCLVAWLKFAGKLSFNPGENIARQLIDQLEQPATRFGAIRQRIEILDSWNDLPEAVRDRINRRPIPGRNALVG